MYKISKCLKVNMDNDGYMYIYTYIIIFYMNVFEKQYIFMWRIRIKWCLTTRCCKSLIPLLQELMPSSWSGPCPTAQQGQKQGSRTGLKRRSDRDEGPMRDSRGTNCSTSSCSPETLHQPHSSALGPVELAPEKLDVKSLFTFSAETLIHKNTENASSKITSTPPFLSRQRAGLSKWSFLASTGRIYYSRSYWLLLLFVLQPC